MIAILSESINHSKGVGTALGIPESISSYVIDFNDLPSEFNLLIVDSENYDRVLSTKDLSYISENRVVTSTDMQVYLESILDSLESLKFEDDLCKSIVDVFNNVKLFQLRFSLGYSTKDNTVYTKPLNSLTFDILSIVKNSFNKSNFKLC